jgi:hypothetical protein
MTRAEAYLKLARLLDEAGVFNRVYWRRADDGAYFGRVRDRHVRLSDEIQKAIADYLAAA